MAYTVSPLRLELHRDALARLWVENMSDPRIESAVAARLQWLYEEPLTPRVTTVVCRDSASDELVGCGSFLHRATWVGGRALRGGVLCDFAVARAHRVGGVAVAIQRALIEAAGAAGIELLYGHPNEKSVAVFRRIGYEVVGHATSWAKPLRLGARLREVLGWDAAATFAAAPVNAGLEALDRLRAGGSPALRGEVVPGADARVEALWDRARGRYGVVGEQSSGYLDWRYRGSAGGDHRIFGVFPPDDRRLAGFAVFTVSGRKAVVSDLFAEHLESCLQPLALLLARHLRSLGAEWVSLSYVGSPAIGSQLMSVGFVPRPGRRPVVVYPAGVDEAARRRVLDRDSWFMLEGELDL